MTPPLRPRAADGRDGFVTGLHHALLVAGIVLIGSALAIAPLLRTRSAVAPATAR